MAWVLDHPIFLFVISLAPHFFSCFNTLQLLPPRFRGSLPEIKLYSLFLRSALTRVILLLIRPRSFPRYTKKQHKMSPDGADNIEAGDVNKAHVDNVEFVANAAKPNARKEAPPYVAGLDAEERIRAEKALVRKIDLRLLPMIIIMYILNYLDRNNIVGSYSCQQLVNQGY